MKVVVGLGNPGLEYEQTRHNVGWMVVDALGKKSVATFSFQKKFQAEIGEIDGGLLLKPQTFMNKSGEAVGLVIRFYQVALENLYVIHDDLDIMFGQYKIQKGIGPKQHNGLQSIYTALGTKDFWHVRVGIENRGTRSTKSTGGMESMESRITRRDKWMRGEEYVLQQFSQDEKLKIDGVIEKVIEDLSKR